MDVFDVGVIGAGIHGASAAFHLSSRGVKTVVFDRGGVASGPTGRSSAICRAYYTNEFLATVARDSLEIFHNFAASCPGADAGFRETGFLYLHSAHDEQQTRDTVSRLNSLGTVAELLTRDQLHERFPLFDLAGVDLGVWEPYAGYADPHGTTAGLLNRARELGAQVRLNRSVMRIEANPHGGATAVTSDGMRTSCSKLLIAAGPWSSMLARDIGVALPLTVERHFVATITRPEGEPICGHADIVGGYYCRPEGSRLHCLGGLLPQDVVDPDRYDERISSAETEELIELALHRVPKFRDAKATGGWASLYDVSPDWQPVIGEIAEGVFVDAGTSGHGFKLGPALGRHVADMLTGHLVDPRLAQFHPDRFNRGDHLAAGYGAARIIG